MPFRLNVQSTGGFWLAPTICGAILVLIGVLIYTYPRLLELVVAAVFIVTGLSMVAAGWRMRPRVRYRRLGDDPPDAPH